MRECALLSLRTVNISTPAALSPIHIVIKVAMLLLINDMNDRRLKAPYHQRTILCVDIDSIVDVFYTLGVL